MAYWVKMHLLIHRLKEHGILEQTWAWESNQGRCYHAPDGL